MEYRRDIDGLRALAVVLVVAFHAAPTIFPSGFVGVDLFFVISGFLISRITLDSSVRGEFKWGGFYKRRILRIFPALLTVLISTSIAGLMFLTSDELMSLGKHIAAGSGFVSNLVLWSEAGYFDASAESKPLLHLWSLGIEEQFYIFWPVLIFVFKRWGGRVLEKVIWIFILLSFVWSVASLIQDPVASFYSPLSRSWELLVGAALGLWIHRNPTSAEQFNRTQGAALTLLFLVLMMVVLLTYSKATSFPGVAACAPVLAAAVFIVRGREGYVNRLLSHRCLVTLGQWSYPLYLWHWPVYTFARLLSYEEPSVLLMLALTALNVGLAWATVRWIEGPLRHSKHPRAIQILLLGVLALGGSFGSWYAYKENLRHEPTETQRISAECGRHYKAICFASTEKPNIILMGDSHAQQLFPSMDRIKGMSAYLVGTCAPLDGVKIEVAKANHPCQGTKNFVPEKLMALKDHPTAKTVVLSALWKHYLDGEISNPRERDMWPDFKVVSDGGALNENQREDLVFNGLVKVIDEIKKQKRNVVFVRDNPYLDKELRDQCRTTGLRHVTECSLPKEQFLNRDRENILVRRISNKYPEIEIVDPLESLCDERNCYFIHHGVYWYKDNHHLTDAGASLVVDDIKAKMIQRGWIK